MHITYLCYFKPCLNKVKQLLFISHFTIRRRGIIMIICNKIPQLQEQVHSCNCYTDLMFVYER